MLFTFEYEFDVGVTQTKEIQIIHTQCARMDLNKRFLPKPMTTTG